MDGSAKLPPPAPVGITELKNNFASIAKRVHDTSVPCTVLKQGRAYVAIVPVDPGYRTPATNTRGCCAACSRSAGTPTTTGSRSCSAGATRTTSPSRRSILPIPRTEHIVKPEGKDRPMLPTIIIGAFALAILWPFIKLGYELIKLAGSLALLVASCAIGAVALVGRGAWALISAAGAKKEKPVEHPSAPRERIPALPEYSSVR